MIYKPGRSVHNMLDFNVELVKGFERDHGYGKGHLPWYPCNYVHHSWFLLTSEIHSGHCPKMEIDSL